MDMTIVPVEVPGGKWGMACRMAGKPPMPVGPATHQNAVQARRCPHAAFWAKHIGAMGATAIDALQAFLEGNVYPSSVTVLQLDKLALDWARAPSAAKAMAKKEKKGPEPAEPPKSLETGTVNDGEGVEESALKATKKKSKRSRK